MSDRASRIKRGVARIRRRVHERTASPGVQPIDIHVLIAPLRYDVIVRAQFFDFLARNSDLVGQDLLEAARHTNYRAWFENIECARFFPALLDNNQLLNERFAARVFGAVRLLRSFESSGFNKGSPVTLIRAPLGSFSDSGAPAMGGMHIGDGCHRLALLLRQGAHLEPTMYRVRPLLSPLVDNTAVLLRHKVVTEAEYVSFLAARFPVGDTKTVQDAAVRVKSTAPSLVGDLRAIVASQWTTTRG